MNTLWYTAPAGDWNEALPLGNGRLGAMVYGRPWHELIQLNEESLWSSPYRDRNNRDCLPNRRKMDELLRRGKTAEARELAVETMSGTPPHQAVYQTAGTLVLDMYTADGSGRTAAEGENGSEPPVSVYRRELDMETAIASTAFSTETTLPSTAFFSKNTDGSSISYLREVFASASADVLVIHLSASIPKSIYFRAHFERGVFSSRHYALGGDTIAMEDTHGIPFCAMATVSLSGGRVETRGAYLVVEGADEATLYVDVESAFRNARYRRSGGAVHRNADRMASWCADHALRKLCLAASQPYEEHRAFHRAEYKALYGTCSLSLTEGNGEGAKLSAVELRTAGTDSPACAELYWNYGRYLLISSSRSPGTLPVPMQGLWNPDYVPRGGAYALDDGLAQCYDVAALCAVPQTALPLFVWLRQLWRHGKKTADLMYGCDGFVAHRASDVWADSAPHGSDASRSYWPLGAVACALQVRRHYEYTLDKGFLRRHFYILRDACDFFVDFLRSPWGGEGYGGTEEDAALVSQLFAVTLQSAQDLLIPDSNGGVIRWKDALERLGASREAHVSAGDEHEGRAAVRRLRNAVAEGNAEEAYRLLSSRWKGHLEPNFCDADATERMACAMGHVSAMTRMLVSGECVDGRVEISLLSAQPAAWPQGMIRDVAVPGNLRVTMEWRDSAITAAKITALADCDHCKKIAIRYRGRRYEAELRDGAVDVLNVLPSTVR